MLDIVDLKKKTKNKELEFFIYNGFIYCKDVKSEETVIVGEYKDVIIENSKIIFRIGANETWHIMEQSYKLKKGVKKAQKNIKKS